MSTVYGYARVSSEGQDLANQRKALTETGATKIFSEKVSGAAHKLTARKELEKLLKALKPGDVMIVCKLDRLARSTRDLLNILHRVAEAKATFKSLSDGWADTTTPHGKLMLTVLGGLAEFERELIKARTTEGRKHAIARGVKMGRKSKLKPHQQAEAIARVNAGETMVAVARTFDVNHAAISRLVARAQAGPGGAATN